MGRGPGWTADQTATLLRMAARNAAWSEIAAAIGRSVASCKNKLAHPSRLPEQAAKIRLRDVVRPRWTAETEAELLRLRDVEKLNWLDIDSHFGRMHGSCSHKYNRLKGGVVTDGPGERKPPAIKVAWSEADMKQAEALWREWFVDVWGTTAPRHERAVVFDRIGRELKRTGPAIENRLRMYGASFGLNLHTRPLPQPVVVSQAQIDARARYAAQLRQDPSARLLGDPPPGYSELDKRRQGCSGSSSSTVSLSRAGQ